MGARISIRWIEDSKIKGWRFFSGFPAWGVIIHSEAGRLNGFPKDALDADLIKAVESETNGRYPHADYEVER